VELPENLKYTASHEWIADNDPHLFRQAGQNVQERRGRIGHDE
jgi:hypothetical protein